MRFENAALEVSEINDSFKRIWTGAMKHEDTTLSVSSFSSPRIVMLKSFGTCYEKRPRRADEILRASLR
jgi:hypothetical protein